MRSGRGAHQLGYTSIPRFGSVLTHLSTLTDTPFLQLFIGRKGSCADIGVVATDRIAAGEELAVIPRSALLTASTGVATSAIASDSELLDQLEGNSSWVPLLLTLIAEYAQKVSSYPSLGKTIISNASVGEQPLAALLRPSPQQQGMWSPLALVQGRQGETAVRNGSGPAGEERSRTDC